MIFHSASIWTAALLIHVDGLFLCSEEGKTAILILPIVALEPQVEVDMARLGLRFVSLTCSLVESLEELIRVTKSHVLIGNVESLTSPAIQRRISKLKISYIAIDEAQVIVWFDFKGPQNSLLQLLGGRS